MILKLILFLTFTALMAWVVTPDNPIEIETLSGTYHNIFKYQENSSEYSQIQNLTFYPNSTWHYDVEGHNDSGGYIRNGKNVNITGKRFIHEDFRILKNKSLRDSVGRVWKKKG